MCSLFLLLKLPSCKGVNQTSHMAAQSNLPQTHENMIFRGSNLPNFGAPQKSLKSILPFIWIFEFLLLLPFLLGSYNRLSIILNLSSIQETHHGHTQILTYPRPNLRENKARKYFTITSINGSLVNFTMGFNVNFLHFRLRPFPCVPVITPPLPLSLRKAQRKRDCYRDNFKFPQLSFQKE